MGLLPPPARPAPAKRLGRARDGQRSRLYRWEQEHVFPLTGTRLTLAACRDLVERVFRAAERPAAGEAWSPPVVTDGRGRRHACGSRSVIKLPRWARTRAVVLHECAHGLAADMHGPVFTAVYIELLARFAGLERERLHRSAATAGVTVGRLPPRLRRSLSAAAEADAQQPLSVARFSATGRRRPRGRSRTGPSIGEAS